MKINGQQLNRNSLQIRVSNVATAIFALTSLHSKFLRILSIFNCIGKVRDEDHSMDGCGACLRIQTRVLLEVMSGFSRKQQIVQHSAEQ